jgi:CRP-like cAMP-binding protein
MENNKIESYDTGAEIFSEGQPGNTMFVLVSGAVALKKSERILRIVDTPDDFFGESSLVVGGPRIFTAMAMRPSKLLRIDEKDFERVIMTNGKFALKLIKVLAERLRDAGA